MYPAILAATLFAAVFLFFGLYYPHHLHFQEQYQLFLFDASYINDIISVPGGIADLTGRFLTQFFLLAWVGAAIVALLLVGIFLLSWRISPKGWLQPAGLLPAIILWLFFCNENALLGAIVAILLTLLADWGMSAIQHKRLRLAIRIISAPVLYWALGPLAIICGLLPLITSIRSRDKVEILASAVTILIMAVMPLIAHCSVAIPLERLFLSPHYFRQILDIPYILWMAAATTVLLPLLPATRQSQWKSIAVLALVVCCTGYAVKSSFNRASEDVMSYDFMCRFQQWNRLIDTANQKRPRNSLSCTALNLALGMKGLLADHMFEYNQNGLAGLLPPFDRDPISPLTTGEAYFQLGLINTAQRFVFEAQEAIQDYQKSGRCYKRLAETNLICGNYEVARKYIDALSKTIFYSDWARDVMPLLGNDEAVAKHEVYGRLRSLMPDKDYMFQEGDFTEVLSNQVLANGSNRLAYEYLQSACLLQRDIESFVSNLKMGDKIQYQYMPYMFQQAYILWWSSKHNAQDKTPEFISPNVIAGLNQFYGATQQRPVNKNSIAARFGNTYWFYYFMQ